MYWDEDNRLMVLSDNGKTSRYTYNAGGERIIKSHGSMEGVYINGAPQGITFHEHDDYTLYPASIISINKNRFTKHYFIGDKRIASKIGTGQFNNVYGINGNIVTAGQRDYAARMQNIEAQREEYYKKLGTPPGIPTMKGNYADPENTGVGYNTIIGELGDHSVPKGWPQTPKFSQPGTPPGPPVQWNPPTNPEDVPAGYGYVASDTTREETFFYHSDHLGSTSYITDKDANITQFDAYLPYGELLVDEHSSSENLPYKFNGKEMDEETGLYYYGARYMDPKISMWLGVDKHAESYPHIGCAVYCIDNPVGVFDTDGNDILPGLVQLKNTSGNGIFRDYHSNRNYMEAMRRFAQTTYGKQFIGSFLRNNQSHYGVHGNGKYSDVTLQINQIDFTNPTDQFLFTGNAEGSFSARVADGKLFIVLMLDVKGKSIDDLTETITHELALHGSKLDDIVKAFRKGGKDAVDKLMQKDPGGENEHKALGEKNIKVRSARNYHKTMQ